MSGRRTDLFVALSVNAAPVVGVLFLEWSLAALVLLYWFELGVDLVLAAIRGLFAQRPSEADEDPLLIGAFQHKRGGVGIPRTDLEIQAATVPVLLAAVPIFGLVWVVVGTIAIGSVGQALAENPIDERAALTILVGAIGVVVGRSYETLTEYFLAGEYESVSVQRALQSGFWPTIVVGGAMIVGGAAVLSGLPAALVILATVAGKLGFDLADVYRDRLVVFDERDRVDLGFASEPDEWTAIEVEQSGPVRLVRSGRRALLLDGVVRGLSIPAVWLLVACVGGFAAIAYAGGSSGGAARIGIVGLGVVGAYAGFGVTDRVIRSLGMEYRVGRDVVGYDRLFERAQWRVPGWKFERCEPERTLADRLRGTETLVVEHDGRTIRVPHVSDVAALEPDEPTDEGQSVTAREGN